MPQESSAKDATVLCTKGCPRCIKKRAETAKKNHLLQLFQNASLKTMNPSPAMYRPQLRFKKRCSRSSMRQQECKVQRPAGFRASILSMVHYETAVWMQCSCRISATLVRALGKRHSTKSADLASSGCSMGPRQCCCYWLRSLCRSPSAPLALPRAGPAVDLGHPCCLALQLAYVISCPRAPPHPLRSCGTLALVVAVEEQLSS